MESRLEMSDKDKYGFLLSHTTNLIRGDSKCKLVRKPDGGLTYEYAADDMAFEFTLLCEVGVPYQMPFVRKIRELLEKGFIFETRELRDRPWLQDFLVAPVARDATWQLEQAERANQIRDEKHEG